MAPGCVLWLTGLSGAGKTTLALRLARLLRSLGRRVQMLDRDEIRATVSRDLGFSNEDRATNVRRIAALAGEVAGNGGIAIVAAISPHRATRDEVRREIGEFIEVYVKCPLDVLIRRDIKGPYSRALKGEIADFTGISAPYEPPIAPEVVVETDRATVGECAAQILATVDATDLLALRRRVPT